MLMNSFLFVCVGNICRSPALKGMLEHLLKERGITAYVKSCGLHATFLGNPPDRRMQEVAHKHGVILQNQAKIFESAYFDQFDAIFCVTAEVLSSIRSMAHSSEHHRKVLMATHYSKLHPDDPIPDPYFNASDGFETVWSIVEDACKGILDKFYLDKK
ncbi:low molecular weight protein-tyrosine-phosphatase [Candidatus Neptunichlamydia sp. REUL1]|uniref:low molecular weight protein-tyrosine-phosphatase n=1 Tax=Candidatus Neptunichlamydia sp. REUL1 TaxID=3064277 RepID=UPI00292CD5C4|nr:low molecular weight protein-tyrosine-phosphatase [Candidatus Neptunochlamydia sp. REUL1]